MAKRLTAKTVALPDGEKTNGHGLPGKIDGGNCQRQTT